jgi:hypothetical protein
MSYTRSNLYASRVYAEHPVALWSMDEPNYFVSLLSKEEKEITEPYWDFSNAVSSSASFTISGYPFDDLDVNKIYLESASASPIEYMVSLSSSISYSEFDSSKGSVCVSNYIYIPEETSILHADIGFIIDEEEFYTRYSFLKTNNWEKISHTNIISNNGFVPFIRVAFDPDVDSNEEDSSLYFNGVSVGQWSEPHNSISTGIPFNELNNLSASISSLIDFEYDIQFKSIDTYGYDDFDNGYALCLNNSFLAELSGVPMVYGSSGNIKLNKNMFNLVFGGSSSSVYEESIDGGSSSSYYIEYIDGGDSFLTSYNISEEQYKKFPSLIFPGKGFLNQFGYNKTLTTEFWLRISPETISQTRIFGPLKSNDGIYIDKDFIKVNVGKYTKSYFIGKWYRPMLVHFCQSPNEIFLMINGEKVISIPIESLAINTFPTKEEDFLGFYTDEKIYLHEIDSFSIFPYIVAEQVAKKRYVFGQGVQEQENIIGALNGTLSYVDFPFSGYSSTIKYPDRTKWEDGFYNNVVANSQGISLPEYQLPEIIFNNNTDLSNFEKSEIFSGFYQENYLIQDENYPFIVMDPTDSYISNGSYGKIYFAKLNQTNYQTRSIHSILKSSNDVSTRQSLIYLSNNTQTNIFEVAINSGSIQYLYNDIVLNSAPVSENSYFAVGIDFDKIEQSYHSTVGSFFSRPDTLSLSFAGNQQDVFLGKIFSLTINNDFFTDKDGNSIFNSSGLAVKDFNADLYNYIGSYTLLPKQSNTEMALDVGVSGYWENSIPLSYFGKFITQSNGDLKYDLDVIQFNIDAPTSIFSKYNEDSSNYQESLSTKVYVTLQNILEIGKTVYTQFANTELIGMERVLDLGEVTSSEDTKYKINDGTVIYPPKDISGFTNYYITIHIEISSKGINTEQVRVKNMELSSLSFDEGQFYSINSPAAGKFYPITKNEDQYVYKRNIPVIIDTESSPYLYLSGDSGIEVLPEVDENLIKGIAVPINESIKPTQEVVGLQMFLMYNESNYFNERKKIGQIFSSNNSFDIVLVPEEDGKRAFFKIFDTKKGTEFTTAKSFLNGKLVNEIVIYPLSWNHIVISLQENSISLDGIIGQIEIYSGVKVDNVASFIELNPIKQNLIVYDEWSVVDDEEWDYWSSSATWTQVLDAQSLEITVLSLDGKEVFNTYNGLSSGIASDNSIVNVNSDSVVILNDIDWDTYLV